MIALPGHPNFVEKPKMRGGRTLEEAAAMIERRRSGGLTIQAFCEAENINVATYYYWNQRLRLKESDETSVLVPINIEKTGRRCEADMENLELTYPNGVRISVPRYSELNLIRELILIIYGMFALTDSLQYYLCTGSTDMRNV